MTRGAERVLDVIFTFWDYAVESERFEAKKLL